MNSLPRDVLSGEDFLDCLFPSDSGMVSPNPSTPHQLKLLSSPHAPELPLEVGRAYKWAQLLGGLSFPALSQKDAGVDAHNLMEVGQELFEEASLNCSVLLPSHVGYQLIYIN